MNNDKDYCTGDISIFETVNDNFENGIEIDVFMKVDSSGIKHDDTLSIGTRENFYENEELDDIKKQLTNKESIILPFVMQKFSIRQISQKTQICESNVAMMISSIKEKGYKVE